MLVLLLLKVVAEASCLIAVAQLLLALALALALALSFTFCSRLLFSRLFCRFFSMFVNLYNIYIGFVINYINKPSSTKCSKAVHCPLAIRYCMDQCSHIYRYRNQKPIQW